MTEVGLIDTTLRDGQQSYWAMRMTTDMLLPSLPLLDRAGYHSIEFMATVHMEVCVRYLQENPWERIRRVRHHIKHTPLRMLGMTMFFNVSQRLPDDVVELFTTTCVRAGIEQIWVNALMNDVRTAYAGLRAARAAGCQTEGSIQFTTSPVHTDDFFAGVAKEFIDLGVDALVVKDAGGLLTPERAKTLFPALRAVTGNVPIYCHSHCVTGMGPAANLAAIEHGANATWTCTTPLANGPSLPADEAMARNLAAMGYDTGVDQEVLGEVAAYFTELAERHGKPMGKVAEYDPAHYVHHMPGGMLSSFRVQLEELGMSDRLEAVLEEMPRVREEMGWPNVQTPFSQFIGTQALLNVVHGRYEVVPDEVKQYFLGYWGRPPGPLDQDVLDKVGGGREPVTERPGELVPPMVERVRREQGPFFSDEELLLALLFMPGTLDQMRDAEIRRAREADLSLGGHSSVADLIKHVASSPGFRRLSVQGGFTATEGGQHRVAPNAEPEGA